MPPGRRTENEGCWICKARRKKCDQNRPTCDNCDSLNIGCSYGPKPPWMDGGDRQRRKTATLKNEIKRNVAYKRGKAHIPDQTTASTANHRFDIISDMKLPGNLLSGQPTVATKPNHRTLAQGGATETGDERTMVASLPWSHQQHQRSETLEGASASELNFVMKYLDFVFPALFPFQQSHLFETGRSWLLLLLRTSRIAYHATLSLSCYYFTLALTDAEEGAEHAVCKQLRWEEVEKETSRCFESLTADVMALNLNSRGLSYTISERVGLMSSIVQVVVFELAVGKVSPWNTHLTAAIALFEEILASSEACLMYQNKSQSKFGSVLLGIGKPLWTNPGPSNHIWSPEQAGFRFCAGLLVFIDIIASTATQESPRLLRYHSEVLSLVDDGLPAVGEAEIRLSSIVGCRNGVFRSIADISALSRLPRTELVDQSHRIATELNIIHDNFSVDVTLFRTDRIPLDSGHKPSISSVPDLIWVLGAQTYLSVVSNGWQLTDPKTRANVAQMIGLLGMIRSDQLRTLVWPLCVAGCLALEDEEPAFTTLISKLGRTQRTGALNDAREVMGRVWENRRIKAFENWDLASCFAILGSSVLLV